MQKFLQKKKGKTFVLPITVLKTTTDQVLDMCIQDYSIKKISSEVKLHFTDIKSFEAIWTHLKRMKHEFANEALWSRSYWPR